jgi:hypothetical protein
MATMTITIPDAIAQRVVEAVCARHGYDPDNPDHGSKTAFAKQQLILWLRTTTVEYEAEVAAKTAQNEAATVAQAEISNIT